MSTDRCPEDIPFLERSVEELGWIKSNYCLLIAGIAGYDFVQELLKRFPKLRIIAMDQVPHIIESARLYNTWDSVTYCTADIERRETLKYWFGTARKILTYHNLERVSDVEIAFKNFYDLLVPGGTLAIRFTPQSPTFSWVKDIFFRWRQFVHDIDATSIAQSTKDYSDFSYQDMLRSIGFEILYFRSLDEQSNLGSDTQCKKFLISSCLTLFYFLPDRMKRGFVDDMFHRFTKYSTKNDRGENIMNHRTVEIFLKKPKLL